MSNYNQIVIRIHVIINVLFIKTKYKWQVIQTFCVNLTSMIVWKEEESNIVILSWTLMNVPKSASLDVKIFYT